MHAKSIQSNNVISGSLTERLKRTKRFQRGWLYDLKVAKN